MQTLPNPIPPQSLTRIQTAPWIFPLKYPDLHKPALYFSYDMLAIPYRAAHELLLDHSYFSLLDVGDVETTRTLVNLYAEKRSLLGAEALYWQSRFRPTACQWKHVRQFDWTWEDRDAFYVISPTKELHAGHLQIYEETIHWTEV